MPTVNPSPFGPKPQFELSDGTPAVGNQLFFYVAGSSTKQNTYTDSTGVSANPNPIVLNSLGMPTNQLWFTAGQTYKAVYAPANDTDPPQSPIWTIDNLTGINDVSASVSEWIAGPAPTYIGATQFSLVGDQTATFQVGRRVRTTNTGGTIYSYIIASTFAVGITTVTVLSDSGTLDSGLSAVSYGLLTALSPSIPALNGARATTTFGVGNTPPATSGAGISFPATQSASSDANTLDDYEEGTWTPTVVSAGGGSGTYTSQTGTYTKNGRIVTAIFDLLLSSKAGFSAGVASIGGLPFTVLNSDGAFATGPVIWSGTTSSLYSMTAFCTKNTTNAALKTTAGAVTTSQNVSIADLANATGLTGSVVYNASA